MKKRRSASSGQLGGNRERTPARASDIDKLAYEIFARLRSEDCDLTTEDPKTFIARAARTLLQELGRDHALVQEALQELPKPQREALFLHLDGLTCAQIANRLHKTRDSVFTNLADAYAQLRFKLEGLGKPMTSERRLRRNS